MITINGKKELIRIESWEDILERPISQRYRLKSIELEAILPTDIDSNFIIGKLLKGVG